MKFLILSFFLLPNVYSAEFSINKEDIKPSGWDNPLVSTEKEEIAVYKSSKLYVFEIKQSRPRKKHCPISKVSEFRFWDIIFSKKTETTVFP